MNVLLELHMFEGLPNDTTRCTAKKVLEMCTEIVKQPTQHCFRMVWKVKSQSEKEGRAEGA